MKQNQKILMAGKKYRSSQERNGGGEGRGERSSSGAISNGGT